ncbi:MAG: zeta toxin family protein [Alphaproteobacteria bacterium]|nr:zeta toxin family protein [Alphaproteobacteria bacterium]
MNFLSNFFPDRVSCETAEELRTKFFLDGEQPVRPKLIFDVAQPGAGKSTLASILFQQAQNGEAWWRLDKDKLREFCPTYSAAKNNPFTMSLFTNQTSQKCYRTILQTALQSKQNILVEGGVRSAAYIALLGFAIKARGYSIDMHIMGAHWRDSLLGIVSRFEAGLENSDVARWVCLRKHELAVRTIIGMTRRIEQLPLCHSITVHKRPYVSTKLSNTSPNREKASQLLQAVHCGIWTQQRREDHLHQAESLRDKVHSRKKYSPPWYRELMTRIVLQAQDLVDGNDGVLHVDCHAPLTKIESARLQSVRPPLSRKDYALNHLKNYGVVKRF